MSASRPARRPSRSLLAVLVLASVTAVTVDRQGGPASPFEPAREAVGEVLGPVQKASALVARPLREVPGFLTANRALRQDVARLQAEVEGLRGQLATTSEVRLRAAELDGLLLASQRSGLALVPARVVAMGPAQSFTRTVTIDAGTSSGVRADQTVVSDAGLVGRVIRAGRGSATVLLAVDQDSVVGARLGSDGEVGFLRGRGRIGGSSRLDLDLVDDAETPGEDDVVLTWGSGSSSPYVPGVPIGQVEAVVASPREQAKHAVVVPFVDFTALDLVGVVVDADAAPGDRGVIRAGELPGRQDGGPAGAAGTQEGR